MSTTLVPATTYPAVLGKTIVEIRKDKTISQGDLAGAVNVTASTWSKIERGVSALTIEQLVLAAKALDKTPGYIVKAADDAAAQLRLQGIEVREGRIGDSNTGLVLIGVAAIGLVLATILASKK